jgi:hypothetical protein
MARVMKPWDAMDRYEAGLDVRREVLGPEYVDQGLRVAAEVLDGAEQGATAQSGDGSAHTPTTRPGAAPRGDGCS